MRFLLNMNVSRAVARTLEGMGQSCVHARDAGLAQASDVAIVDFARKNEMAIVTHDLDYGDLLMTTEEPRPSAVIFRLRRSSPTAMSRRIQEAWKAMHQAIGTGAIVIIEDTTVRIRLTSSEE